MVAVRLKRKLECILLCTILARISRGAEYPWTFDNDLFGGKFYKSLVCSVLLSKLPGSGIAIVEQKTYP
ncbi:unnamed protein product [Gongylonema pulchrum]|uniref:Secreted protein n=1 Tax=Gongylonema pulchrum TaxID=637853 RepID=A0A183DHP0_9BILA|nr:unnamed protein product [Gongylonema pulchrum]